MISHKHNGRIKIITGVRRCGKSYLLFNLFKQYLIDQGVKLDHILEIAFDDRKNKKYRNPDKCFEYIDATIDKSSLDYYYILLDEVQLMKEFSDVLNGFLHIPNVDVYVTGSNSKFLSKDVVTEFRGRGDEVKMYPLSFAEFYSVYGHDFEDAWNQYYTYGGLPYILSLEEPTEKVNYLQNLFDETYIKDIIERNNIRNDRELKVLIDIIASAVGSLVNPQRLSDTFKSAGKTEISAPTIKRYLDYLQDAFIITSAQRYDVKGKRYISTPMKYYFEDIGLRNARLNFRQQEETHIMENILFNELRYRGYVVDVGLVEFREKGKSEKYYKKQLEIDFIANQGSKRYYIQSAFHLLSAEKKIQEERPLLNLADSFKKIIVVKDNIMIKRDEKGIVTMGIKDFLLNPNSLDF
ncbi:MAG: ATP-binding protein [Sphaerochaetaceae bacterium]